MSRLLVILGLTVAVAGALGGVPALEVLRGLTIARWTGYGALTFLLLSQAMAPAANLRLVSPRFQAIARRDFGLAAALLAAVHAFWQWRTTLAEHLWTHLEDQVWLQFGLVALILLLVLGATSYPRLVRALRLRVWKPLHRLAYAAAAFACLHVALSPWSDVRLSTALAILLGSLWILRWNVLR